MAIERMTSLASVLSSSDACIVLDGGLATELERNGCDINSALWSAEILINKPTIVEQVHLDYYISGADVAITASYQASVAGLTKYQSGWTSEDAEALIKRSVQLARNASIAARSQGITRPLFVAGSVGPYGAYLADGSEYRGDYALSTEDMMAFHRPRMQALVAAGVDVLALETIPSYTEAESLLQLLAEFPGMQAWVSFTLRDEGHISDGTPLRKVVSLIAAKEQICAMGINCVSETLAEQALAIFRTLTDKPLVIYPNSGEVYDATNKTWSGEQSQGLSLKDKATQWKKLGARLIGGCCRTTPDSIRTISSAIH
jgi:homocysteine S-methyltransferase